MNQGLYCNISVLRLEMIFSVELVFYLVITYVPSLGFVQLRCWCCWSRELEHIKKWTSWFVEQTIIERYPIAGFREQDWQTGSSIQTGFDWWNVRQLAFKIETLINTSISVCYYVSYRARWDGRNGEAEQNVNWQSFLLLSCLPARYRNLSHPLIGYSDSSRKS